MENKNLLDELTALIAKNPSGNQALALYGLIKMLDTDAQAIFALRKLKMLSETTRQYFYQLFEFYAKGECEKTAWQDFVKQLDALIENRSGS
jgi:hypothetical protein